MKLYTNGCSYTWGAHLSPLEHPLLLPYDTEHVPLNEFNHSSLNAARLKLVWPHHLGSLLNCSETYNHSFMLSSNDRIVRKTIDFFLDKLYNDLSEWLVVIQWTDPSRFEFFDEDSNSWVLVNNQLVLTETPRLVSEEESKLIRSCYKFYSEVDYSTKLFSNIVTLGNFLKVHNINYVFTSMGPISLSETYTEYLNENFVWYNNDISTTSIQQMNVDIDCGDIPCVGHPTVKAHKDIAEKIFEFINLLC